MSHDDKKGAASQNELAVKLAAKHAPHLLELQRKRLETNAKIDHEELRYFGEFAKAFFGDREALSSRNPSKTHSLGAYTERLRKAGIEIDRQAIRRRIIAYFVNEKLGASRSSAVNKLGQTHLNALDPVDDAYFTALAEAAVAGGWSSRQLLEAAAALPSDGDGSLEPESTTEITWSSSRVAKRITTVAQIFEKQFQDAPAHVRTAAIKKLLARLTKEAS